MPDVYVVRDTRQNGRAVTWGSDRERMDLVASWDPAYEVWPDMGATWLFWHVKMGYNATHPYDLPQVFLATRRP